MNLNSYKLMAVFVSVLLMPGTLIIAAETDAPSNETYDPAR